MARSTGKSAQLILQADVVIMPYRYEDVDSVLEAMEAGLPMCD
jgi:glycosyltransferase involved in cell wall biosynthesis